MKMAAITVCLAMALPVASAREYHVSTGGNDAHPGTAAAPLRTVSTAARVAGAGDVITVHEGIYRERISPTRGGESDEKRIVYRAAPGERGVLKGSEVIKGWQKTQNDTWQTSP